MTDPAADTIATVAAAAAGAEAPSYLPATAGALLRRGREAAGISLDAVAQQLKLAPRQVRALEEDNFAGLPGRTFVRGFVRNYARLVRIDPEPVLAALAGADPASLDSPSLQATAPTIGELPTTAHSKPGWTRWAIPLTLVAVIATAAVYEFSRGHGDPRRGLGTSHMAVEPESGAPKPAPAAQPATQPAAQPGTPLPNPLATPPAPAMATPDAPPTAATPSTGAPAPAVAAQPAAAPSAAAPAATDGILVLTFRDSSWTEVKDGNGRLLMSQMMTAGQVRSISGTPPFDLVIGNATEASVTFRGKPVDLTPYMRQNVARLVLQ